MFGSSGSFKFDCNAVFPGVSLKVEQLEKSRKPLGDVRPDSAGQYWQLSGPVRNGTAGC